MLTRNASIESNEGTISLKDNYIFAASPIPTLTMEQPSSIKQFKKVS